MTVQIVSGKSRFIATVEIQVGHDKMYRWGERMYLNHKFIEEQLSLNYPLRCLTTRSVLILLRKCVTNV